MGLIELPVRSDFPSYEFTCDLDGVVYTLKFRYNVRFARWVMDIADSIAEDIVTGIPMLTDIDLLAHISNEDLPPGRFILVDETGASRNPGETDLGNDIKLIYEEAS